MKKEKGIKRGGEESTTKKKTELESAKKYKKVRERARKKTT